MTQKKSIPFEAAGRTVRAAPGVPGAHRFSPFAPFVAGVAALAALGCSPPHLRLAGTNDAALTYAIGAEPATGKIPEPAATAAAIKARLSAAQITADVEPVDSRVRIVVDADEANTVDRLVLWRGGLDAFRAGPVTPTPASADAIATLPLASVESALHGRALSVTFTASGREAMLAERATNPDHERAHVTLAMGHSPLATLRIDEALATPVVLHFGTGPKDVTAFTRASRAELLLESPTLPPLRRVSVEHLPPNWSLAAACAVLPFVLSLGWLLFVRRFDRARPEPLWLVVATFGLGGLSVVPAGLAEMAFEEASPWFDPAVMTLGGHAWALPVSILVFSLVVGMSEEGSKFFGAWSLARHRREFDEPVDGIIYGCAAALGFAAVENVKYFAIGRMSGMVIALRAFVTVPAHMFFGAIWGYALGQTLVTRQARPIAFFALAAIAHGTFDAILSTDGMQLVATLVVLALAFAFVAMLRISLTHGAVARPRRARPGVDGDDESIAPASDLTRVHFRVGSPGAFYACAAGLIVCAFALTVLGGAYELLHHRIGVVFIGIATIILVLFGLAAYGVSETIPLDVAVDAWGVTFGGARTPLRAVLTVDVEVRGTHGTVLLRTAQRIVRLGPAPLETAAAMADAIRGNGPVSRPR